jgi:peptidoglycan/xylan/chitin deacetylase (PgdA/CDA1 family)
MKTCVIFGFDMESDIGSYLKSYRGVQQGTPVLLEILQRHGLPATFFFTGDAARANPEVVKEVARRGFEVGCHSLKHETVGDAHFDMPGDIPILEEEVEHRLELNKKIVQELCGTEPVSFRAPRLWQGQAQLAALEKLGFRVDASYSVFAHAERLLPYHPARDNWLVPGDMRILEIPNFAFDPSTYNYERFFCKHDQWPLLRLQGARFVFERLGNVLRRQEEAQAQAAAAGSELGVLLFYLHPWEFQPMPARYVYPEGTMHFRPELHTNCGRRMAAEFERFIQLALRDGWLFSSCRDFPAVWEARRS